VTGCNGLFQGRGVDVADLEVRWGNGISFPDNLLDEYVFGVLHVSCLKGAMSPIGYEYKKKTWQTFGRETMLGTVLF
jgi:hypothetical protein